MKKTNVFLAMAITSIIAFGFTNKNNRAIKSDIVVGTEIGNKAPELKFKNPQGKEISLSSLKGNIVFVDFWASWCKPCRKENSSVVSAYNKFNQAKFKNAKGFVIYSVSLDQDKESWAKAIETDKLSWATHVSDLKGWSSEAAMKYGVNTIPNNFLLNSDGIIIAKNLREEALEQQINTLLKD